MNEDEMIKDMADRMDDYCQSTKECPHFRLEDEDYEITCSICRARSLYNANYRKVGEDEIVIKQTDYVELNKDFYDWKKEYDHNCLLRLEVFELEKQLEKTKQETARKILQELSFLIEVNSFWDEFNSFWLKATGNKLGLIKADDITGFIRNEATKYGIELE